MSADAAAATRDAATANKWLILGTATFCTILYAMAVTIASVASCTLAIVSPVAA